MKRFKDTKCNTVNDVIDLLNGGIAGSMIISLVHGDKTNYEALFMTLVECVSQGVDELKRITGVTVKDGEKI